MSQNVYELTESIQKEWAQFVDVDGEATLKSARERKNLIRLMENTKRDLSEQVTASDVAGYDPVLIPMIRRTQPSMVTTGLCGNQPMSGPTGLVFAYRVETKSPAGAVTEVWNSSAPDKDFTKLADTATSEQLGAALETDSTSVSTNEPVVQSNPWPEVQFTIEKVTVTAEPRALKATFTDELAYDLRKLHGIDAEMELVNICSTEIVAEQDREILYEINRQAVPGGNVQADGTTAGTTHVNVANFDGRWAVEKYQMFAIYIDAQASLIARNTRRGRGNFIITSSNVAGALDMAGRLNTDVQFGMMAPDTTGPAYVGVLAGKYRVYVDPYAKGDYVTIGYKGVNDYDAGLFIAPYVPLRLYKARGENDFQPRIGFKTRRGLVSNPYYKGTGGAALSDDGTNQYFRTFAVLNILNPA